MYLLAINQRRKEVNYTRPITINFRISVFVVVEDLKRKRTTEQLKANGDRE